MPPPGMELVEGYLFALNAERHLSVYTVRNYQSDLSHLLAWLELHRVAPRAITRAVFREYLGALAAANTAASVPPDVGNSSTATSCPSFH